MRIFSFVPIFALAAMTRSAIMTVFVPVSLLDYEEQFDDARASFPLRIVVVGGSQSQSLLSTGVSNFVHGHSLDTTSHVVSMNDSHVSSISSSLQMRLSFIHLHVT